MEQQIKIFRVSLVWHFIYENLLFSFLFSGEELYECLNKIVDGTCIIPGSVLTAIELTQDCCFRDSASVEPFTDGEFAPEEQPSLLSGRAGGNSVAEYACKISQVEDKFGFAPVSLTITSASVDIGLIEPSSQCSKLAKYSSGIPTTKELITPRCQFTQDFALYESSVSYGFSQVS